MIVTGDQVDDDGGFVFWDEKDFDGEVGIQLEKILDNHQEICSDFEKRVVHCYVEDWEELALTNKKDVAGVERVKEKYGGLTFYDPDTDNMVTVDRKNLQWSSMKTAFGWCIITRWVEPKDGDDGELTWHLSNEQPSCALHDAIIDHFAQHPDPCIEIITKEKEDNDN
jgi:hypothetical protein